jgi:hypothetical protein
MGDIIETKKCLNCNSQLEQSEGKRSKVFCDSTCRSNYWQRSEALEKQGKNAEEIVAYLAKNFATKRPKKLKNFHKVIAETPQEVVEYVKEVMDDQENEDIKRQIAAIKAEKIPEHRNKSSFGRKSWEMEQKNRIEELQKQLP